MKGGTRQRAEQRNARAPVIINPQLLAHDIELVIDLRQDGPADSELLAEGSGLLGARLWQLAVKRSLDLVGSLVLLVVMSPLLLIGAVLVRLTSRGPAVYWQERVGRNGRVFRMAKFRSMVHDAHRERQQLAAMNELEGPVFKIKRDPRVTRIGRLIRRWSIDEFPNLFNVVIGDMSLVGPRPPLPEEVLTYGPREYQRLWVKPGVTCGWQVNGRSDVSFEHWMQMDLDYIGTWSLRKDLLLLIKTPAAVLRGKGAY